MCNLSEEFDRECDGVIKPSGIAFVAIDVQRIYCDPTFDDLGTVETAEIAKAIARFLPYVKRTNVTSVAIFMDNAANPNDDVLERARMAWGGFYETNPEDWDMVLPKINGSAFSETNIEQQLKDAGTGHLVICGFNAAACVLSSVYDAIELGFKVSIIPNLIGQGYSFGSDYELKADSLSYMESLGVRAITPREFLHMANGLTTQPQIRASSSKPSHHGGAG